MKLLPYLLPMSIIGSICMWINYKFKISENLFSLLKIKTPNNRMLFYLFATIVLSLLVSFICDDILHVSENAQKIIQGALIGIAFSFIPAFHTSSSKIQCR